MTFLQLQNAVMNDRFDESQRGDVQNWINAKYWEVWTLEEWTFRYGTDLVSVTTGSQTVGSLPADLENVRSLQRGDGESVDSMDPTDFQRTYNDPRAPWTGLPEAYTVINGVVSVGPASSETAADYLMVYEKEYTKLVADGDIPLLPAGSHEALLVFGPSSLGLKLQNDFTWQFFDQTYQSGLDVLRRGYLRDRRDSYQSYAADPISQVW